MHRSDLQMATVDLVDDLQVARQEMSEQVDRPTLQSLGEHRVVGVSTGTNNDVPGLHPNDTRPHIRELSTAQWLTISIARYMYTSLSNQN